MKLQGTKAKTYVIATLLFAMLWLPACNNPKTAGNASDVDTLCVDSATYSKSDSTNGRNISVRIRADYPTPITGTLSAGIAAWIRKNLGKGTPSDTMSAQAVIDYFGNAKFETARNTSAISPRTYYNADCRMVSNRKDYVSFTLSVEENAGDAHGVKSLQGITFRKSDGKTFGWDMVTDTNSNGLRKLVREGVRSYFQKSLGEENVSDENLRSLLVTDMGEMQADSNPLEKFPMPQTPPYLTRKGMTFVFQPYEISPSSSGTPTFTVPFNEIMPFMTKEARKLLNKK